MTPSAVTARWSLLRTHCALFLLAPFLLSSIELASAQSMDGLGRILESKEEKYRREQEEANRQQENNRRLEQELQSQQDELRQLEAEKRRLMQGPKSSPSTSPRPSAQHAAVQVYVVDNCPACFKTIGFLDALNVNYQILRIDNSIDAEQLYLQRFGRGDVPVVETPNGTVRGYNQIQLKRLLSPSSMNSNSVSRSVEPKASSSPQASLPPAAKNPSQRAPAAGAMTAPTQSSQNSIDEENNFDVSKTLPPSAAPTESADAEASPSSDASETSAD